MLRILKLSSIAVLGLAVLTVPSTSKAQQADIDIVEFNVGFDIVTQSGNLGGLDEELGPNLPGGMIGVCWLDAVHYSYVTTSPQPAGSWSTAFDISMTWRRKDQPWWSSAYGKQYISGSAHSFSQMTWCEGTFDSGSPWNNCSWRFYKLFVSLSDSGLFLTDASIQNKNYPN
jgi:hypothetical protein